MRSIRKRRLVDLLPLALVLTVGPASGAEHGLPSGTIPAAGGGSTQTVRAHFFGPAQCLRVAVAGVRTQNADPAPPTASGTVVLPAGPTASNIVWAGLYWSVLANLVPANAVTLNGNPVTPVALPATLDPCWPAAAVFGYFADVTGLVVAGANVVAGLDDSGVFLSSPETQGASLVAVYESDATMACEIIIMDGHDTITTCGQQIDTTLPVTCGAGLPGTLTFIGGNGQTGPTYPAAYDNQLWNGSLLGDYDDFDASDPPAPGASADIGWDTDSWAVITGAPNQASINTSCPGGDCVDWVAAVLEVGVQSCQPVSVDRENWGRTKSRYRE